MIVWIDAQLPPTLVRWFKQVTHVEAVAVGSLGLREATDLQIYLAARARGVVVVTKDRDFAELSSRLGPPPQVILMTCGNTTNSRLREILGAQWEAIVVRIAEGDPIIEIHSV